MHKIISLLTFALLATSNAPAQTQQGYVKTKGRLGQNGQVIPGTRLSGATIMLMGGSSTYSAAQGTFSIKVVGGKYVLSNVTKEGYNLIDTEVLKGYKYSANPLVLTMESRLQQRTDKSNAARMVRDQLNRKIQQQRDEIELLRKQKQLTEEKYQEAMLKLLDMEESNQNLVEKMADEYSKVDYDLVDNFNRQFNALFLAGELEKADSLLRTRGDIHADLEALNKLHDANEEVRQNLEKSESMEQLKRNDLAERCYKQHELYLMQHQLDSAAYYITLRSQLDSTNVKWLLEAGRFVRDYISDYTLALSYFQNALRRARVQEGEQSANAGTCYNDIGELYLCQENFTKALEYLEKSLSIRLTVNNATHPNVAESYNNMGVVYYSLKQYPQALESYEKAYEIWNAVYGESHSDVAAICSNLGVLYNNQHDYTKALSFHEKALSINLSLYGENHQNVAMNYHHIGRVYENQKLYSQARDAYKKALNIRILVYGERHPSVATSYNSIGVLYRHMGDYVQALENLQKALSIDESILSPNSKSIARIKRNIEKTKEAMETAK